MFWDDAPSHKYTEADAFEYLGTLKLPFFKTGSREICSPPPMDTDVDFVVLDLNGVGSFDASGFVLGTEVDHEEYDAVDFVAYRQGEVNLIVVDSWEMFRAWRAATAAAKQMNLKNKRDRIQLFQGVLYGNW